MKVGLTATMIQGGRSGVAQYVFSLVRELIRARQVDLSVFVLEDELPLLDFAKDGCRLVPVPRAAARGLKRWSSRGALPCKATKQDPPG